MKPVAVVIVMVLMLGVGVYVGVSGLADQAGLNLDLSRGSASEITCSPDRTTASIGQTVYFAIAGLDVGTPYHWSSPSGRSGILSDGRLFVTYTEKGERTVSAFFSSS